MNKVLQNLTGHLALPMARVKKHSPALLLAGGIVGFGATVVLACRATLKVEEVLEEHKLEEMTLVSAGEGEHENVSDSELQRRKGVLLLKTGGKIAKLYALPFFVGAASVAALAGGHKVQSNRLAGVGAAYAAVDQAFKKYRANVIEKFGTEIDLELRHGFEDREYVEDTPDGPAVKTLRQPDGSEPSMYARLFDESNKNFSRDPHYNQQFIGCQQNWANDLLAAKKVVLLNEVYELLGFKPTKAGSMVGWVYDPERFKTKGDGYIDFGVLTGDRYSGQRFINGEIDSIWLDFNVDGIVNDLLDEV